MPAGGTFSSNGYDLGTPSQVTSFVPRPVIPMATIPGHMHPMSFNPADDFGAPKFLREDSTKTWAYAAMVVGALSISGALAYWYYSSRQ